MRAHVDPEPTIAEVWPLLAQVTPPDVMAPDAWMSLAPLVATIPGPVVGFERSVRQASPTEWGFPLPRWQRATALALDHPAAAHIRTLARAWANHPGLDALCDLQMHTWDIVDGVSTTPCAFLRVDHRAGSGTDSRWKQMVRGYAAALRHEGALMPGLSWADVADRLEDAADTTPLTDVGSVGVYLGRPGCPVRLTVPASKRPHADHPGWVTVDEVVAATRWPVDRVIVAFAPGTDPGDTWNVPLPVDRHPRPAQALVPLLAALVERGLATTADAQAIGAFDVRRTLPLANPTLDGVPATATLWVAPERIKVVVDPTGWRSAKLDFLGRVIWRSVTGQVLVDH